jgi:NADH-quinone oxidoreductase subunit E
MLEIASQMILCLLLAALLGAIIGYLFGKSTCASDDCGQTIDTHATEDTHSTSTEAHGIAAVTTTDTNEETDTVGIAPELLSGPRNGEKDNLTRVKGIGVKIDETLNEIGIYHFDQIASWNEDNVAWVDANVAFPGRVKREQWVEQAKALALGEETEFSKRVDKGEVASSKKD